MTGERGHGRRILCSKGGGVEMNETWTFTVQPDGITWRIARKYLSGGTLEDTYFPGWDFTDKSWTGALLGTGGVAWFKLFDTPVATLRRAHRAGHVLEQRERFLPADRAHGVRGQACLPSASAGIRTG